MLCFRVFVRIHSRRSLDSFLDLNPILCPRFLNSFPCHTSAPRGPSHFGSAHLPSSSCRRKGRRRPQPLPHFCLSPILFLFTFLRTLFQKHRGWGHTLIQTAKHSQLRTLGGNSLPRITGHGTPNTSYQSLPSPAPQCYHSEET